MLESWFMVRALFLPPLVGACCAPVCSPAYIGELPACGCVQRVHWAGSQPGAVISNAPYLPQANHILAALPRKASRRFLAGLTSVDLALGEVLYQARRASRHVYFPN